RLHVAAVVLPKHDPPFLALLHLTDRRRRPWRLELVKHIANVYVLSFGGPELASPTGDADSAALLVRDVHLIPHAAWLSEWLRLSSRSGLNPSSRGSASGIACAI